MLLWTEIILVLEKAVLKWNVLGVSVATDVAAKAP